jgi:palmitoyltransferase ZDHHC9/14/18
MPFLYVIGIILQLAASILLIVTATKDPATIPTRRFLKRAYQRPKIDDIYGQDRNKYLDVVRGKVVKIKYCPTCEIYRPPRAVHCALCGCCIERLDHHCPWIGTCVGKRNYKYFIMFMWSLFLTCVFGIGCCAFHVTMKFEKFTGT